MNSSEDNRPEPASTGDSHASVGTSVGISVGSHRSVDWSSTLALTLIALSGAWVLGTQLRLAAIEKPLLEAQLNYSAQRLTATKTTQLQTTEALKNREEQIKQAGELETKYAALLTDLIELAKVDADARALVQKWKIQQQGGASSGTETRPEPSGAEQRSSKQSQAPAAAPASTPASKLKTPFVPGASSP